MDQISGCCLVKCSQRLGTTLGESGGTLWVERAVLESKALYIILVCILFWNRSNANTLQWVVSFTNLKNSDSENFTFSRCKILHLMQ